MDAAARRAEYADARFVRTRAERVATRNGVVTVQLARSDGIGVASARRGLGLCGTGGPTRRTPRRRWRGRSWWPSRPAGGRRTAARARAARARVVGGPAERDPFAVPLEGKLDLSVAADAGLRADPGVVMPLAPSCACAWSRLSPRRRGRCAGSADRVRRRGLRGRGGRRREPGAFFPGSHRGDVARRLGALPLAGPGGGRPAGRGGGGRPAPAPACPPGRQRGAGRGAAGLQVHESIGHALGLDRMLGGEASYAGTSLVSGRPRVGSLRLDRPGIVTADAGWPAGSGRSGGTTRAWGPASAALPGRRAGAASSPRGTPLRRSDSSARAGARGRTATPASRSCG